MVHSLFLVFILLFLGGCTNQQPTLCISQEALLSKSHTELSLVAQSIKEQEKAMEDFATFIEIMKEYVSDYSKTIETSAYLSNLLRVLPIPYAGEVSNATKLVASNLVTLNNTATALRKYKESSSIFLNQYNQLGTNPIPQKLVQLARYGDNTLITDALYLEGNMEQIAKTTEGILLISHIITTASSTTLAYLEKAKSFLGNKQEISIEEKNRLTQSKNSFQSNLVELNKGILMLKNSGMIHRQTISKAKVIAELAIEITPNH